MEPITVPFTFTEDDYVRAYRRFTYRKVNYYISKAIYLLVALAFILALLIWNGNVYTPFEWLFLLSLVLIAYAAYLYFERGMAKQQIRKNKQLTMPGTVEYSEEGVTLTNGLMQASYKWENFRGFYENEEFLYLLHVEDPKAYLFLAKRFIASPEQLEQIRALFQQQIRPPQGKR